MMESTVSAGAACCVVSHLFLADFFLVFVFFLVFALARLAGLAQPASICSYDFDEIVERDFGRLVPAFLRRLILATREFFGAAMVAASPSETRANTVCVD